MERKNKLYWTIVGVIICFIAVIALVFFCIAKQQFQILTGFACGALFIWGLLSIWSQKQSDCIVAINMEDAKDALAYVLKHQYGTSDVFINLFGKKVYDYFLSNDIIRVTSKVIEDTSMKCEVWEVTAKAIEVYSSKFKA